MHKTFWSGLLFVSIVLYARGHISYSTPSGISDTPPNILFISIDDLRNDLGVLGVKHAHTPYLDAFAEKGRLFRNHYVQAPVCGPSRASLLRGKRPSGDPRENEEYARQIRHAYYASTSYVDAQIGRVLKSLEELGLHDNTIVVIWSDHGFALGEHGIYGKHSLYEIALKSPLIISFPGIIKPGAISNAIVESIDIYPTLTDLSGLPAPEELEGTSLRPQLEDPEASSSKPAFSYFRGQRDELGRQTSGGQTSVRTQEWRLIRHRTDGEVVGLELFDFRNNPDGTRLDPQSHPGVVDQLSALLESLPWQN